MIKPAAICQHSLKIATVAAACAVVAIGLQGCGVGDAASPPVTVANTPPVQALTSVAKYQLVLRNGATGALITDSVAVTLSGAGTVNMSGVATTSFTSTDGLVAFASAPGVAAGGTIRVSTQSRAAGWTDGDAVVTINASDAVQNVEIRLTNITRVAEIPAAVPVAAVAAPVAITGGATTAVVAAATTPKVVSLPGGGSSTIAAASVSIPAATRITNAAGQTPTGPLQVTVIAPSLNTVEGQAAIPGTTAADGTELLVSGLMTNLLTDATGARFTNFSSSVTARMPIASGTFTEDGARLLAAGDTARIYVWNDAIKRLDFRTNGTVVSTPSGLVAEYPTSSFSTYVSGSRFPATRCTATLNITGRPAGDTRAVSVNRGGPIFSPITGDTYSESVAFNAAAGIVVGANQYTVRVDGGSSASGRLSCGNSTVALSFPVPPTGAIVVSTTEACANGTNSRALPTNVSAVTGNASPLSAYTTGGAATIGNLPAGTYTVTATGTGGRANITQSVTVGTAAANANFVFPLACTTVSGGG